jgi:hypothetical protein
MTQARDWEIYISKGKRNNLPLQILKVNVPIQILDLWSERKLCEA